MDKDEHIGKKILTYTFTKRLGRGAFGSVYAAFDTRTNKTVACKVIPQHKLDEEPKLEELVQTEAAVLRKCRNENVIGLVEDFRTTRNIYICMEYCNGGDLEGYIKNKGGKLREDEALGFIKQILNGFKVWKNVMQGLHEVNAMHRDFKSANVLLHNGVAKIADLGFAKILQGPKTGTVLGTCLTMAPEVLEHKPYGFECDVWSLGVVFYEMVIGMYPFSAVNDMEVLRKIRKGPPNFPQQVPISNNCKDFILQCLTVDPRKRISWKAIYEHPLFQQAKVSMIRNVNTTFDINESLEFYKNYQPKQPQKPQPQKFAVVEVAEPGKPNDDKYIQKQLEEQKTKEEQIKQYMDTYLEQRNLIMLILKYGVTPIYSLDHLPLSHHLYAFLMCKKAYFEMVNLQKRVESRINPGNQDFWKGFFQSKEYRGLHELVRGDKELIYNNAITFMLEIQTKNPMLQAELNLDGYTSKFQEILRQELKSYALQLFDCRNKTPDNKAVIMRLITFLCDLTNGIQIRSESYEEALESLDIQKMEQNFGAFRQQALSK